MQRYLFDIHDDDAIIADEQGLNLPDLKAAEVEAVDSLADMVKNMPDGVESHRVAIRVRTDKGPIFTAALVFDVVRH